MRKLLQVLGLLMGGTEPPPPPKRKRGMRTTRELLAEIDRKKATKGSGVR